MLQQASKPKKPRNREIGEVKGLSMGGRIRASQDGLRPGWGKCLNPRNWIRHRWVMTGRQRRSVGIMIGIGEGLDTQVPKIMMDHQTERGLRTRSIYGNVSLYLWLTVWCCGWVEDVSFVFLCWKVEIQNVNQVSWAINYIPASWEEDCELHLFKQLLMWHIF